MPLLLSAYVRSVIYSLDTVEVYTLRTGNWSFPPRLIRRRSGLACVAFQVILSRKMLAVFYRLWLCFLAGYGSSPNKNVGFNYF